ncbi:MAG: hypothetical protein CL674_01000 [Bdellovibrionaceae bacterium]|nr:hypothetical protein [Pseudobdellovibrionaceae bacterium]|tara:strand:- start:202 stop:549 length:348 start_codon:yes stop_codon:yes gene_type:complete
MMNTVQVIGRIITEVEAKTSKTGKSYVDFLIADNQNGSSDMYRVKHFPRSENLFWGKGDLVAIAGSFKTISEPGGVGLEIMATRVTGLESRIYKYARRDENIMAILKEGMEQNGE